MNNLPQVQVPDTSKKYSIAIYLQYIVLISAILYFGRALFIPMSISLLISFLLYPVCAWFEKKGINKSLAIVFSILLLVLFASGIIYLLALQFIGFYKEWDGLIIKIEEAVQQVEAFLKSNFNIVVEKKYGWIDYFLNSSGAQVIPFLKSTTYSITVLVVFLILIPLMSALILYYRSLLLEAINILFPGDPVVIGNILRDTVQSYYRFIKGMILVYLIVGTLNSIGLAIVGIPHPLLFGFLAAIMTIIPYVGIIIASLLPITVGWLTYNSIWYPVGVIIVFAMVQFLEANVIFPVAVGTQLRINTLAVIITIIAGGILWGGAGMILFIPFLGIVKLIADKTNKLKFISVLLGSQK